MKASGPLKAGGAASFILLLGLLLFAVDVVAQSRGRTVERAPGRTAVQTDTTRQDVRGGAAATPAGESQSQRHRGREGAVESPSQPSSVDRQASGTGGAATRGDRTTDVSAPRTRDQQDVTDRQRAARERSARNEPAPAPRPQPAPVVVSPRPAPAPVVVVRPQPPPMVRPVYATNRWSPRYVYRQTYYVDSGWGPFRRSVRVEVHTELRHRVRRVRADHKLVDIQIQRISVFERGRFVGDVTRLPGQMSTMRATVHRNGYVDLDQMLYVVGERRTGFELIATRSYRGMFYDHFRPSHRMRIGELDFRSRRVVPARYSRLVGDGRFDGYVPVPLLHYDDDWYFIHGYYDTRGYYYYDFDWFYAHQTTAHPAPNAPRGQTAAPQPRQGAMSPRGRSEMTRGEPAFTNQRDDRFKTQDGAEIRIRREVEINRVD